MRIEITPKLWELSEPLLGPFLAESMPLIDTLTDDEIEHVSEFLRGVMEIQARHTQRIREL